MLRLGEMQVSYNSRGNATYQLEMWHDGLHKHRLIRGSAAEIIKRKATLQAEQWEEQWMSVQEREEIHETRARTQQQLASNREKAAAATREAQQRLDALATILQATLTVNDAINWSTLLDTAGYPVPHPTQQPDPVPPSKPKIRREPLRTDLSYQPEFGILDRLMTARREQKIADAETRFAADHAAWKREVDRIESDFWMATDAFEHQRRTGFQKYQDECALWEAAKRTYLDKQEAGNRAIAEKKAKYLNTDPGAIQEYCDLVLSNSDYPEYFPQEFKLDYDPSAKTLIVDYSLPAPDDLPTLREVKYVATKDAFVEQHIPEGQRPKLYDDVVYQIVLRTIHELFEADVVRALEAVVINGYVTAIAKSTGKKVTACILSLRAPRTEFDQINLSSVEPRACFKALKGVGSSKLSGLAAVAPLVEMRREDGRFVAAHDVANTLDASTNLAAMDWEEFEYLIRDVFEQEFTSSGGEVKVTRASRDGGVDAIAFDPDPIRGGKIVIQAKRYTNTVGVSAVRDLFGTVMNEGANKGILVTTSDYGPDAYSFATGKPLVLLNGANLLFMLEKHGHKARIDIAEARRLASELSG